MICSKCNTEVTRRVYILIELPVRETEFSKDVMVKASTKILGYDMERIKYYCQCSEEERE